MVLMAALVMVAGSTSFCSADVSYDGRSLIIGGERKIIFSGSIHYPRSTPEVNHSPLLFQYSSTNSFVVLLLVVVGTISGITRRIRERRESELSRSR